MAEVGKQPNIYQNIKDNKMDKPLDLENVKIYTYAKQDIIEAMDLLGEEVYLSEWIDFSSYVKDKLTRVIYADDRYPYWCSGENSDQWGYKYAVLVKDVKTKEEKKLRPFKDAEEFFEETGLELGKTIRCRKKGDIDRECVVIISGYTTDGHILLGGGVYYKFKDLFDKYEYYDIYNLFWKPFGVEEE